MSDRVIVGSVIVISKRKFVLGASAALVAVNPGSVLAHHINKNAGPGPGVAKKWHPQTVNYRSGYSVGTVVVDPRNHFLYLIQSRSKARRYGVGVGKAGLAFKGSATIKRKAEWPSWTPTKNMIRREPAKYAKYAGGVPGGPGNPLGARALYLYKGSRDTYYRIHGTTQPSSIGRSVSNGCIRMVNAHVIDLYDRVPIGAQVVVI